MLETLLAEVCRKYGVDTPRPSRIFKRKSGHRLHWVPPVLAVFFNLPYDFGRLVADQPAVLRSVASGAESYRLSVGRFEVQVTKMILGNSSSFDWTVRDMETHLGARVRGIDMTGYWKTSLRAAAKAMGCKEKIDIEAQIHGIYEKTMESLTHDEWWRFKRYAGGDAETTLELYHATVRRLMEISPVVIDRNGIIPQSAPGAAAKVVFSRAFDEHPGEDQWGRYPAYADKMGCAAYYGGRSFCVRPGVHSRMTVLDLKSAYPFQMSLLPDPVTVVMKGVKPRDKFDLDTWRGKYGVLYVDGEATDDLIPAFRIRDEENKRLRYVAGKFENIAVTIPELVIGHVRGALRISKIRRGVVMLGSAHASFLRAGMREYFRIKEDSRLEKSLRDMAKLLANATYGKLVEVAVVELLIAGQIPVPQFAAVELVAPSIIQLYAECGPTDKLDKIYFGANTALRDRAVAVYLRFIAALDEKTEMRPLAAVVAYVQALISVGEPVSQPGLVRLDDYVRAHRRYRCGRYFLPLYAAQITGATSAMLGLMAHCTDAWQGDTDSVHVRLSDDISTAYDHPGFTRYFELMDAAGYTSPRLMSPEPGARSPEPVDGIESLGSWTEETPEPSVESVLVRPKLYSHRMPDGTYKQAKHGFAKYHTPEIDVVLHDTSLSPEDRQETAGKIRKQALHEAMLEIVGGTTHTYRTRKSPRRLREALATGKQVGEFVSRVVSVSMVRDPNTYIDTSGRNRWKPLEV